MGKGLRGRKRICQDVLQKRGISYHVALCENKEENNGGSFRREAELRSGQCRANSTVAILRWPRCSPHCCLLSGLLGKAFRSSLGSYKHSIFRQPTSDGLSFPALPPPFVQEVCPRRSLSLRSLSPPPIHLLPTLTTKRHPARGRTGGTGDVELPRRWPPCPAQPYQLLCPLVNAPGVRSRSQV